MFTPADLKMDMPKPPFVIYKGKVEEEFARLHKDGKSLLKAESKFVQFLGLQELTDRACDHVELANPTKNTIIFNIRTPTSPCFFVKPHVGMIDPGGKATLYFTFKGRCHRVPSDYCWIYSIYQLVVDEKTTAFIKEDEFSSQNLRSAWIKHGRKQVNNILHLASSFKAGKPKFECRDGHRKFLERKIYLNDLGDVENSGKSKTENTTDITPANMKKGKLNKAASSDTMDDLPKTAD